MEDVAPITDVSGLDTQAQAYINNIVYTFQSTQKWMYDIFRQDELDHTAVTCAIENQDAFNQAMQNPYQFLNTCVNDEDMLDGWRSLFNSTIFARAKAIALAAHIAQAYDQNGRSPVGVMPTELSDAEQKPGLSEEQRKQIILAAKTASQKATQKVMDVLQEGGALDELKKTHTYFPLFGIACGEFGIFRNKKETTYVKPQPPTIPGMMPEEGRFEVKNRLVYTVEVTPPYDIILDPAADGDPQKGVAAVRVRKLTPFEAQDWVERMVDIRESMPDHFGEFSEDAAEQILDTLTQDDAISSTGAYVNAEQDSEAEQMNTADTRTVRMNTVYMSVFRKKLEEWGFKKLLAALDNDPFYRGAKKSKMAQYEIEAVTLNDVLVYVGPNLMPDKRRPIFWSRRIPVYGTNYGFSIYSIVRPLTRELTRMVRNALDNMSLASNLMLAIDEDRLDPAAIEFSPGKFIRIKGKKGVTPQKLSDAIEQLQLSSMNSDVYRLYDTLMFALDEVSNVPKNMTGLGQGTKTAFEIRENMSSAQTVTLEQVKRIDNDVYKAVVENCYQFILLDPAVSSDYKSDACVQVTGAQTFLKQVVEKQKKLELMQILSGMPQEAQARIDWQNLFLSIMQDLNMDDPETLVNPTETVIKQLQEQLAQIQQQFQQAQEQIQKLTEKNQQLSMENNVINRTVDLKSENLKLQLKNNLHEIQKGLDNERAKILESISRGRGVRGSVEKKPEGSGEANQRSRGDSGLVDGQAKPGE